MQVRRMHPPVGYAAASPTVMDTFWLALTGDMSVVIVPLCFVLPGIFGVLIWAVDREAEKPRRR